MDKFDSARPGAIPHAGTFNNNVATMSAGCVVLGELFPPRRPRRTRRVASASARRWRRCSGATRSGSGSRGAARCLRSTPSRPLRWTAPSRPADPALQELLFLGLYRRGIYTAPRGMVNLSLPLTDDQLAVALSALDDTLAELG